MSNFYIVGHTKGEIAQGVGLKLLDTAKDLFLYPNLLRSELNNILIYSISGYKVEESFKEKYGDHYEYDFIKETIWPFINKKMQLYKIGDIDESDIPTGKAIILKF